MPQFRRRSPCAAATCTSVHVPTLHILCLFLLSFSIGQVVSKLPNELLNKIADVENDAHAHVDADIEFEHDHEHDPPFKDATQREDDIDFWSQCKCPANDPNYNAEQNLVPAARMAYLISVHNRRTIN